MKEIYRVLASALGEEQRMAQISQNLANVGTVGYKRDGSAFVDFLAQMEANAQGQPQAAAQVGAGEGENLAAGQWPWLGLGYVDFAQGPLQMTGNPLDVAIDGEGFFQVEGDNGQVFLTRAGNFNMAADGTLQTVNGRTVLDESGRAIKFDPTASGKILISSQGDVRQGPAALGKLGVVGIADPQKLIKIGEGLYQAPADLQPEQLEAPNLRQSMLEGSNVKPIEEMVRMIQTERMFQSAQRALQSMDEITQSRIEAAGQ